MLLVARQETEELRQRLEELTERSERTVHPDPAQAEFVITHVGESDSTADRAVVPDRIGLSATLGEPLVKAAAFTHGLRRALSSRSRNRIWFEMRREVRASRRRRRQLRKQLERDHRARLRSSDALLVGPA
jgi:hypothetical protein